MSLHYRLFGLPCTFCGQPVQRIDVYEIGVRTVHEPGHGPPCDCVHSAPKPRTGAAVEPARPPAGAPASPVRSHWSAA
jgi:hypothetical protein